ncbi:hypothetical protein TWF718_009152 [Orbilia javanica]|uniref:Uncharacterized protein n=1 Tax=Orbilia javanica TaxID=47235 RepID=A0AAN8RMA8_9PEZI
MAASGASSNSKPRLCWQRSPRSQIRPYSNHISCAEDLDNLLAINEESKPQFLYFGSEAHPHHRLIDGALERLATIYHPKLYFCVINMTLLGKDAAVSIAKKYEIDTDYAATAIILEDGEKKATLHIPFIGEKQSMEDFIRDYLGLERIDDPGFGVEGIYTHYRSGTTTYSRES